MTDRYDLQRFVAAQEPVYAQAYAELAAGAKHSHWMWFVFPQHLALGHSPMAKRYGLASLAEAQAYWHHPLLGARLKACTEVMLALTGKTALDILGSPDDLKFRSCMTLFALAVPQEPLFQRALDRYFGGQADTRTVDLCADPNRVARPAH